MGDRHAGASRFLSEFDDDEAERLIDQLSRLVACLRDEDADRRDRPRAEPARVAAHLVRAPGADEDELLDRGGGSPRWSTRPARSGLRSFTGSSLWAARRRQRGRGVPVAARREAADRGRRRRGDAGVGRVPGSAAAGGQSRRGVATGPDPRSACCPSPAPPPQPRIRCSRCCRMSSTRCSGTRTRSRCPTAPATRAVGRLRSAGVRGRSRVWDAVPHRGRDLARDRVGRRARLRPQPRGFDGRRRAAPPARADRGGGGRDDEPGPPAVARWLEAVVQPAAGGGAPNATAAATNSALL